MRVPAASTQLPEKTPAQESTLLPLLFQHINEEQRVTVFHAGPALRDTVDFFSNYRCRLHFVDLFSELPIVAVDDTESSLQSQFEDMLQFPEGTLFDICLFWDLFNFLNSEAISAFIAALGPYLKTSSLAHAFSVHNINTPQPSYLYGINQLDTLSYRGRQALLPGYTPHSQSELKEILSCFRFTRSVLLPDSRLELLLHASL